MNLSPILLFVYNRPAHTRRCIESLSRNLLAVESELFIYADGAKDQTVADEVEEVRQYIRSVQGFKKVILIERNENWGLARNIIDGVSTQVQKYGKVIVLEDDLVVAPHFLRFMNDALETYQDEPKVGHIQACDFTQDASLPDTFLIKWTGSWGWATWERAWKHFNPNGKELLQELEARKLTYTFDFNGKYGFTRMLRRQIEGKNNSWAIRWNASLFLEDILSLNVGRSLVQNEGFDGSGTNCGGGGLYASHLHLEPLPVHKISPVKENQNARQAFIRYYGRTNSFWAKAIRRIKRTLKGDFGA
jgi:glycosyltransferase involved in cell wall biosynthesis